MSKVFCPQCVAVAINGVACHETGCPLSKRPWVESVDGPWALADGEKWCFPGEPVDDDEIDDWELMDLNENGDL